MADTPSKSVSAAADSSQDSPQLAHFKFREKELVAKIERIKNAKPEPGFDYAASIARAEAQLAVIRKEMK